MARVYDPDSPELPQEPDPFAPPEPPEPGDEPSAVAVAPPPAPSSSAAPLSTGSVVTVDGTGYQILHPLAVGGMAEVFLARRRGVAGFERTVAVKRIHAQLAGRERFERMFVQEAQLASRLLHHNIAQVHDLQRDGDGFLLVMEYIAGTTIRAALEAASQRGRTFSLGFACYLAAEVADALHYAHTATDDGGKPLSIIHRDVNPKNIMLGPHGEVKLCDFGVAYSLLADRDKTDTGFIKGTWNYLSPEQASGDDPLDGRSDVFALGLVFAELILGRRVFTGRDTEILLKVTNADPASIGPAVAALPVELQPVLRKALAKHRGERYATAADFARDIRAYLQTMGLVYGAADAAAELVRITSTPDADLGTRLAAPPVNSGDEPLVAAHPPPIPVRAPAVPVSPAPASAAPATAPAAPSAKPPETQEQRLAELRERIRNPHKPTRRLVVPAILILGVIGLGNLLVMFLRSGGANPSKPVPEMVKTETQLRAEREAAEVQLRPPPTPAELAPVAPPAPGTVAAPLSLSPGDGGVPPLAAAGILPAALAPASASSPSAPQTTGRPPRRQAVAQAPPAVPAGPKRRSLDSSTATTFADAPTAPPSGAASVSVPRGTLIAAKLLVPADPTAGPVTAEVTRDVTVSGAVAVPRGALLVCASQGYASGRIQVSCDGLTIGERSVRLSGTGLGTDKRPGLPTTTTGGAGASEHARSGTIDTAAALAARLAGDGLAGDVARGAARVGGNTARDATAPGAPAAQPVPVGTAFFLFVNSFGGLL